MEERNEGFSLHKILLIGAILCLFAFYFSKIYFDIPEYNMPRTAGVQVNEFCRIEVSDFNQIAIAPKDINNQIASNLIYAGEFDCTAYCCEEYNHICGGTGITASGYAQEAGVSAGANFETLKPGTWIYIEGIGIRQVQDTGPDCPADHIDIAVETHAEALEWPYQGIHNVWILKVCND